MKSPDHVTKFPVGIPGSAISTLWRKIKTISISPVIYLVFFPLLGNKTVWLLWRNHLHKFIGRHKLYCINAKLLPVWDHLYQTGKSSPETCRQLSLPGVSPDMYFIEDHIFKVCFRCFLIPPVITISGPEAAAHLVWIFLPRCPKMLSSADPAGTGIQIDFPVYLKIVFQIGYI